MSRPFELEVAAADAPAADATLWVARSRWLPTLDDDGAAHGAMLGGREATGAVVGASLRAFIEHIDRMTPAAMDALAGAVSELCVRALATDLAGRENVVGAEPLVSFVTIRRFVDRNIASPSLGPAMIASSFGLSRSSVYRLFAPVGGLAGYIRLRRLQRAYEEIVAPGKGDYRIGPIAYANGFRNLSAFGRAFREEFGTSPAQARRKAEERRAAPEATQAAKEGGSSGTLLEMLRGIVR